MAETDRRAGEIRADVEGTLVMSLQKFLYFSLLKNKVPGEKPAVEEGVDQYLHGLVDETVFELNRDLQKVTLPREDSNKDTRRNAVVSLKKFLISTYKEEKPKSLTAQDVYTRINSLVTSLIDQLVINLQTQKQAHDLFLGNTADPDDRNRPHSDSEEFIGDGTTHSRPAKSLNN